MQTMKRIDWQQAAGWTAVILSTIITSFWAYWGISENFHEGWYGASWLSNVGLMFVQYLSPMLIFLALTLIAIIWPRVGGGLHVVMALLAAGFFQVGSNTAVLLLILPLIGLGLLYWFGRPQPRKMAIALAVGLPLLTLLLSGIEPVLRVAQRVDDGDRQARTVPGNGVSLVWAPEGPGWPLTGTTWHEAQQACRDLSEDGQTRSATPQRIWRLPTADEAVRSMARHGRNSGGVWDAAAAQATYTSRPDKESPLWNTQSLVIYWWTATEIDDERAYIIVYDGKVWPRAKDLKQDYLGYRCVKSAQPGGE